MVLDKYGKPDYSLMLKDAITQKKSDAVIQELAAQRDAKIAGSPNYKGTMQTQDLLKSWGYTPIADTGGNGVVTPVQVLTPATTPTYDPTADIAKLTDMQRAKSVADLGAKRDASLAGLSEQRAGISPQYQAQRNTQDTSSKIQAKNFAEYMASRGQNNAAGDNGTFNQLKMTSDIANMGALSNLYKQEQGALDMNSRDMTGVNTAYQSDIASANAGIDATAMQNRIQAFKDAQARQDQLDQFNKSYALNVAGLTGEFNGQQTLAGKSASLDNALTQLNIDTSKLKLAELPQQIAQQATITAQQIKSGAIDIATGEAKLRELTNPNSTTNKLAKLSLDTAQFNYEQLPILAQQKANQVANDLANGSISRQEAQMRINQITAENENIKAGLNADGTAKVIPTATKAQITADKITTIRADLDTMPTKDAYNELFYNSGEYIKDIGQADYDKLLAFYKSKYVGAYVKPIGVK